jgi:hypothetical protein
MAFAPVPHLKLTLCDWALEESSSVEIAPALHALSEGGEARSRMPGLAATFTVLVHVTGMHVSAAASEARVRASDFMSAEGGQKGGRG